ncbi:hypothetical protein [Paenibacillus gallinarum]|uniref:Uncharacterized protein n=1 Tax=Paenibacillus gallinarum TaxID=2762232 RepID=A0ABR8T4E8_9BACL|nr:hypothetical protein [Paenibacillus gallinarum]MBD7970628.1 hypothetical protein [Paenibacillus gallinarum]
MYNADEELTDKQTKEAQAEDFYRKRTSDRYRDNVIQVMFESRLLAIVQPKTNKTKNLRKI